MIKDLTNSDHLGDGVYIHFNGFAYEISVNHHENVPVVHMDDNVIEALVRFQKRMKDDKR